MAEFDLPDKARDLIAPDEKVLYFTKQQASLLKPDLTKRLMPDMMIITNHRLIHFHPKGLIRGALGMEDYTDYKYTDLMNVKIDKGMRRSTLIILSKLGGAPAYIKDIPKDDGDEIFKIMTDQLKRISQAPVSTVQVIQQVMPPPPPPPISPINCPICGRPATYIPQYQRHYCYQCQKYI